MHSAAIGLALIVGIPMSMFIIHAAYHGKYGVYLGRW